MSFEELIELYLTSKEYAWTEATKRSERARLNQIAHLLPRGPEALYQGLQHKAPYTVKTTFIRVTTFVAWCVKEGHKKENLFEDWFNHNKRVFKNAYKAKLPEISYDSARARIMALPCKETVKKALQLLDGGLRWTESFTLQDGHVVGKGEKSRRVFVDPVAYPYSYSYFRGHLKTIGLTPHDLRKIRATQLAKKLQSPADICKVFGWESFETASKYLAPIEDQRLKEIMQ